MMSDGMLHYQNVDIPMGEFWLLSPTHDKPNDMLDAISAAHIYGKPIIQAEGYTQIRMDWTENPASLKALGDRVYSLGINRMVYHVWTHNPFMDRKPGMTLDGIGLFLQRDQTWLKPGQAWIQYAQRVQAALQHGVPVTDIAVFTGEETPRRAILPERLVNTLPGIVGKEVVLKEKTRLANIGEPMREFPIGVWNSANTADPENYVDILRGYQYDSFNKDALIRLAKVENGRIVLPGGASYAMLVLPQYHQMKPDSGYMTKETLSKLYELVQQGATVLISDRPQKTPSKSTTSISKYNDIVKELYDGEFTSQNGLLVKSIGKGRVIKTPITTSNFNAIGLERDVIVSENNAHAKDIVWTHRKGEDFDIHFISNQKDQQRTINVSLRKSNYEPELWDAITGEMRVALDWMSKDGRVNLPIRLEPSGSIFIVLRKLANDKEEVKAGNNWIELTPLRPIESPWLVQFDPSFGGPERVQKFITPANWSRNHDRRIKYYSGTAVYNTTFHFNHKVHKRVFLDLGKVVSIAEVKLNGKDCGVAWTTPFQVEITDAIRQGENKLTIEVSNTWRNKLAEDNDLPEDKRQTWTNALWRYKDKPLAEAGLIGPVQILTEK
jgi:hypothetical protein